VIGVAAENVAPPSVERAAKTRLVVSEEPCPVQTATTRPAPSAASSVSIPY